MRKYIVCGFLFFFTIYWSFSQSVDLESVEFNLFQEEVDCIDSTDTILVYVKKTVCMDTGPSNKNSLSKKLRLKKIDLKKCLRRQNIEDSSGNVKDSFIVCKKTLLIPTFFSNLMYSYTDVRCNSIKTAYTQHYPSFTDFRKILLNSTTPSKVSDWMLWLLITNSGYEVQKYISPIAYKIDRHFLGTEQQGVGINISVGVPKIFPISYRWHWGTTQYTQYYDVQFDGVETREGKEFGLLSLYSASYTDFSLQGTDEFNQSTTLLTWGIPFANVQYENDYIHEEKFKFWRALSPSSIKMGDDKDDRWRTAAVRLTAGLLTLGINLVTGDSGPVESRSFETDAFHYSYYIADKEGRFDPDKYSVGICYVGLGPFRIGGNSQGIRNVFQNRWAHKPNNIPYFRVLPVPSSWYWYIGTGTGGTNW